MASIEAVRTREANLLATHPHSGRADRTDAGIVIAGGSICQPRLLDRFLRRELSGASAEHLERRIVLRPLVRETGTGIRLGGVGEVLRSRHEFVYSLGAHVGTGRRRDACSAEQAQPENPIAGARESVVQAHPPESVSAPGSSPVSELVPSSSLGGSGVPVVPSSGSGPVSPPSTVVSAVGPESVEVDLDKEALEKIGISRRTWFRWLKENIVEDVAHKDRKGWRLFTEEDIARISSFAYNLKMPLNKDEPNSIVK